MIEKAFDTFNELIQPNCSIITIKDPLNLLRVSNIFLGTIWFKAIVINIKMNKKVQSNLNEELLQLNHTINLEHSDV